MTPVRTTRWTATLVAAAVAVAAGGVARPAAAQPKLPKAPIVRDLAPQQRKPDRKGDRNDDIPPSARPPAGMCRIWLNDVPPAQQPAPTDCPSAVRNRPPNARVIFGDDYVRRPDGADASSAPELGAYAALDPAGERAHGPSAGGDARWDDAPWGDGPLGGAEPDSTVRRPTAASDARPAARPVSRPLPRPAAVPRVDAPVAGDDWEAGYAAGYRDAMNGRRPRIRGVVRGADRGGAGDDDVDDVDPDRRAPAGGSTGVYPGVRTGSGTAVVVPPGDDPRYFNNGRYAPPGRANGVCLDRDADGWCDDPRYGAPVCRDLDGDGRCDDVPALAAAPYPADLPDMRAGAEWRRGRGSAAALRWLGTSEVIARVSDLRGTGVPTRVTWLDANTGALLQVWSDRDGDGTADRVEVYRDGRRVKVLGR